ncbi:MAG: hypothetical protein ACLQO7_07935 [Candidatus Bathyarchaeia archaeon]
MNLGPVDLYFMMVHETSEIQMSKKNQLEKLCPECEEDMNPVFDKNKVLVCWECTECGTIVLATKEVKQEKP